MASIDTRSKYFHLCLHVLKKAIRASDYGGTAFNVSASDDSSILTEITELTVCRGLMYGDVGNAVREIVSFYRKSIKKKLYLEKNGLLLFIHDFKNTKRNRSY